MTALKSLATVMLLLLSSGGAAFSQIILDWDPQNKFRGAMEPVPSDAVPAYCKPNLKSNYIAPLTQSQIKTCLDAANSWKQKEQQKSQQEYSAYVKEQKWIDIEADNGAVYQVDVAHIRHDGWADVNVRAVEGDMYTPYRFFFDCSQSHRYFEGSNVRTFFYAAPRSVAGKIESIACAKEPN